MSRLFVIFRFKKSQKSKPGGLNSQDQSRSRLQTSLVSRPTFLKCRDFLDGQDLLDGQDQLFFSWLRFLKLRLFCRDFDASRFLSRLLRRVKIVEICRDAVEICWEILTLSRPFESESDEKSRQIEKSRRENTKIHALLDRDQDKVLRNAKIFDRDFLAWTLMSRRNQEVSIWIEIPWLSRLTFLKCRDKVFEKLRSRVSIETTSRQIETTSRQIETPRCSWQSWQRPRIDWKSPDFKNLNWKYPKVFLMTVKNFC